jgi:hypothetical protein
VLGERFVCPWLLVRSQARGSASKEREERVTKRDGRVATRKRIVVFCLSVLLESKIYKRIAPRM